MHLGRGGEEAAVEVGASERPTDLRLVDDPFRVLARDHLPVRREIECREELDRLGADRLEPDRLVEVGTPPADEVEQLDEQGDAEEAGTGDPVLVEAVEQLAERQTGVVLGEQREGVGRAVPLTGEQRQVVTEHVQRDPLHRPRRTLRGGCPLVVGQVPQEVEEVGAFRSQMGRDVERHPGMLSRPVDRRSRNRRHAPPDSAVRDLRLRYEIAATVAETVDAILADVTATLID